MKSQLKKMIIIKKGSLLLTSLGEFIKKCVLKFPLTQVNFYSAGI